MARAIYEVYAKIVDSTGAYNTLNGYPKVYDSNGYDGDVDKTRQRAYGGYWECLGAMAKVDTRKVQFAMIVDGATGQQIEVSMLGDLNPPVPEEEVEE